jgi:hypothetical protein
MRGLFIYAQLHKCINTLYTLKHTKQNTHSSMHRHCLHAENYPKVTQDEACKRASIVLALLIPRRLI